MKKPMTDFVTRGGLGELLAAATQAIKILHMHGHTMDGDRLQSAVNDGIKARELEAKEPAGPMTPRAVCVTCAQLYLVLKGGPRSVGYCSDACYPAENEPRGVV